MYVTERETGDNHKLPLLPMPFISFQFLPLLPIFHVLIVA